MNTLLINPPGKISFISPPLGILYVSASLKSAGNKVFVIDYALEKLNKAKLFNFIEENKIQFVGISIVTPKVFNAMDLAKSIKEKFSNIILIAGGPHATLAPEELLNQCPFFDYIIKGEGENRTKELIKRLENNESIADMDGIVFERGGQITNNPTMGFIEDLNTIIPPDRNAIDILQYSKLLKTSVSPATTMMTSRGCPYQCIYCSKPITGTNLRTVCPENVIKEIEYLVKNYGIKEIIFYDDTFTLDKERATKICNLIIEKNIKIRWQCETRVNLVDEEILKKMKQAGCYMIAYGIESGSNRVLQILKKGITTEQVKKAINITKQSGIKIVGYFMLGIPDETEEEIKQTIKFSQDLDIDFAQFAIATAYPGTALYQIAKQQNKITRDWSKSMYALGGKPIISLSNIPIDKLYDYTKKAYNGFYFRPSYIRKTLSEIKSFDELLYTLRGLKTLVKDIIFS